MTFSDSYSSIFEKALVTLKTVNWSKYYKIIGVFYKLPLYKYLAFYTLDIVEKLKKPIKDSRIWSACSRYIRLHLLCPE